MRAEIAVFHAFMAIAESGHAPLCDVFKALTVELEILNPDLKDDTVKPDPIKHKKYKHGTLKHDPIEQRSHAYSVGIGWVNIWYVPERFQ